MNMQEWHKLTNWNPEGEEAQAEWETIHTVYQWHPAIPDVAGKQVLAGLFKIGGLGLLRDMEEAAKFELLCTEEIRLAEEAVDSAKRAVARAIDNRMALEQEVRRMRAERAVRLQSYTDQGFADQAPVPKRAA
jgi:hypothetical protein